MTILQQILSISDTAYKYYRMTNLHTISITDNVYKKLRTIGNFGESFSDLIGRILTEIEMERSETK